MAIANKRLQLGMDLVWRWKDPVPSNSVWSILNNSVTTNVTIMRIFKVIPDNFQS
jgi:hypothetical protein